MNTTLLGLIVGSIAGALVSRRYAPHHDSEEHSEEQLKKLSVEKTPTQLGPVEEKGKNYRILVSPEGDGLRFRGESGENATKIEVQPSNGATNMVSWDFCFDGHTIIASQIQFEAGTPFYSVLDAASELKRRFTDDTCAFGRELVTKRIKKADWHDARTGLTCIDDGDEFKYNVMVVTRENASGALRVFAADPIVIVRRG